MKKQTEKHCYMKDKKLQEQDILDQAIFQYAPGQQGGVNPYMTQPVFPAGTLPAAAAPTSTVNPLVPPQPGMIPIGWMYPNQGAVASAIETGDVNVAGQSLDGLPIEPEEEQGERDMLSQEEKDLLEEYSKWKERKARIDELKNKVNVRKQIKEKLDELEPVLPQEVDLIEPPTPEDEDFEDFEDFELDEPIADQSVVNKVEDVLLDIADIFGDLGGDVEVNFGEGEEEELEGEEEYFYPEDVEFEDNLGEEEELLENRVRERVKRNIKEMRNKPSANLEKEAIEYRKKALAEMRKRKAGEITFSEKPLSKRQLEDVRNHLKKMREKKSDDDISLTEEAIRFRRRALAEMRKRKREKVVEYTYVDPDDIDKEIGHESVNATIDAVRKRRGESRIMRRTREERKPLDRTFLEKYQEKKSLDFKDLLEKGLLG